MDLKNITTNDLLKELEKRTTSKSNSNVLVLETKSIKFLNI